MYNVSDSYLDAFKTPSRQIAGSIVCDTDNGPVYLKPEGSLIKFIIEKTSPKGKFFGFAVTQKITIEAIGILDSVKKGNRITPTIESKDYNGEEVLLPYFYVDSIEFNKVKNMTTIVGYDILHKLDTASISQFEFTYPVFALNYALDILEPVGGYAEFDGINHLIREAPNLSGTETARTVLAALAEFTGSICYVSDGDTVKFRGMRAEDFSDVILPDDYFDLAVGEPVILDKVASNTEAGDNISYGVDGFTQVLWENPFITLRDDAYDILVAIGNQVRNLSSLDYTLSWRGCPAYEMGDFVLLQEKDGTAQFVRYFNETLEYNGGLRSSSDWESGDGDTIEVAPPSLSKVVSQTYAKVDKVNRQIEMVVSEVDELSKEVGSVTLNKDEILAEVAQSTEGVSSALETITNAFNQITEKSQLYMTKDKVDILIQQELKNGITSVNTTTGYSFDEEGLTISKTGSEMSTTITEDGMKIYKDNTEVLTVNNVGVSATNLHANTYLIIGERSRFEDYSDIDGNARTGCFWIGR